MTIFNSQDIYFMQRALELAREGEMLGEVPVGAVAVINDKIVGSGFNQPINNNDTTAHAEIIALRGASQQLSNYRLPGVTLYVTLEPCIMCIGAMVLARIKRLVFGAADPKTGAVISVYNLLNEKTLNHKIEYQSGLLADECGQILSSFFKAKRFLAH